MIQQKMDKKAYFLGMMNGERLLGELLVSFSCMCENCEFIKTPVYFQTVVGKHLIRSTCHSKILLSFYLKWKLMIKFWISIKIENTLTIEILKF